MSVAPRKRGRSDTAASGKPPLKKPAVQLRPPSAEPEEQDMTVDDIPSYAKGKGLAVSADREGGADDSDSDKSYEEEDDEFGAIEEEEDFLQGKPKTQKAQERVRRRLQDGVSDIPLRNEVK